MIWIRKWEVESATDSSRSYTVSQSDTGEFGCSCPAWIYRRDECSHIRRVKNHLLIRRVKNHLLMGTGVTTGIYEHDVENEFPIRATRATPAYAPNREERVSLGGWRSYTWNQIAKQQAAKRRY
jgi:hypothetical protein